MTRPTPEPADSPLPSDVSPLLDSSLVLLAAESLIADFNDWLLQLHVEAMWEQPEVLAGPANKNETRDDIKAKVDAGNTKDVHRIGRAGVVAVTSSLGFAASMALTAVSWKTAPYQVNTTEKVADVATGATTLVAGGHWWQLQHFRKFKTRMGKTAEHLIGEQTERVASFLDEQPYEFPIPHPKRPGSVEQVVDWSEVPVDELKRGRTAAIALRDRMARIITNGQPEQTADFDPHIFAFATAWNASEVALGLQRETPGISVAG